MSSKLYLYYLREVLTQPFFSLTFLVLVGLLTIWVSGWFLLLGAGIAGAGLILSNLLGRRCPQCGSRLIEGEGRNHPGDLRVMQIIWHCPYDNHTEIESTRFDPAGGGG